MKLLPTITLLILIAIMGMMLYGVYLLIEPFKPPLLAPLVIPILNPNKTIKNDETISTKVSYCIYRKTPSTTTRRIESTTVDRRVYFLSTTESGGSDPGCGTVTSNTFPISSDIPPGRYKIILSTTFRVNPFKTVSATYETEEFNVVK